MKESKGLKRTIGFVVAIVMILSSVGMVFADTINFTDIEGHWAKDRIIEWAEMGVVRGYGDTFRPDNNITRAEFMSLMNKTFFEDITDEEVAEEDITLADVEADAWYAGIVKKAVVAGYISGYGEGIMKPEANITRQEVAAIFSKVFELEQEVEVAEVFADLHTIDTWARGHVGAVSAVRYMTGYTEGETRTFKGNQNITRAEAVAAIDKAITVMLEDLFGGIFDEDFDFEDMFGDLTEEEALAILQELFGDFFGEDFWNSLEGLTEEEVEALLVEALTNLEAMFSEMSDEELEAILENFFRSLFGDFDNMFEGLSEEEIQAILDEMFADFEMDFEELE